jgi:hypothetical protein
MPSPLIAPARTCSRWGRTPSTVHWRQEGSENRTPSRWPVCRVPEARTRGDWRDGEPLTPLPSRRGRGGGVAAVSGRRGGERGSGHLRKEGRRARRRLLRLECGCAGDRQGRGHGEMVQALLCLLIGSTDFYYESNDAKFARHCRVFLYGVTSKFLD